MLIALVGFLFFVCPCFSCEFYLCHSADEIVFSDGEAKDSESEYDDDDTVFAASESKHVDAASDTTLTEEVHDTGDFNKLPLITVVFMLI